MFPFFKNAFLVSSIVAVATLSLPSAQADTFQYRVRIPATSQTCAEEATSLARQFIADTGIESARGECYGVIDATFDQVPAKLYSLSLTYDAKESAPFYSASLGGLMDYNYGSQENGSYTTYQECVAAIPGQSASFKDSTGLYPAAASCAPSSLGSSEGYILSLDAFGTPKRQLRIVHMTFGFDDPAHVARVQGFLSSLGAVIVRTKVDAILYYSESPILVRQSNFGFFNTVAQCQAQMSAVADIFAASGSHSAPIVRCATDQDSAGLVVLNGMADGNQILEPSEAPLKYYTFEECMQDRVRISKDPEYSGAVCSFDVMSGNQFVMQLYRR